MDEELILLNKALDHAVQDDILTDSEADSLYTRFASFKNGE